jgi:hypothetical protein
VARQTNSKARSVEKSGQAFVFPFQYMSGSLPTKIEPRNSVAFHYDLSRLGAPPTLACFLATSADGRNWYAPLRGDSEPVVIADWPEDVAHLALLMVTGPGWPMPPPRLIFELLDLPLFDSETLSDVRIMRSTTQLHYEATF